MAGIVDRITGRSERDLSAALQEATARLAAQEQRINRQAALLAHVRSQLQESTTLDHADKLARTGQWDRLGSSADCDDIERARKGYRDKWSDAAGRRRRFSYSRRAVDMHADFCFGGGLESPICPDESLNDAIGRWWWLRGNQQAMFAMPAQRQLSARLLVDGCLMLACFRGRGSAPMQVRPMERLQFSQVITHPDDDSRVLYYERRYTPAVFKSGRYETGQERVLYYPDIDNTEQNPEYDDPYRDELPIATDERNGLPTHVLRVRLNSLTAHDWGVGIMPALMDWELDMVRLAEHQLSMAEASAALAAVLVVDGDESDVAAAEAYYGMEGTSNTVGGSNSGDINVMNTAAKLNISRAGTGADDAARNTRMFLQAFAVAAGTAPHYLGDSENANLATTTSMELPILRYFEAYQGIWSHVLTRLTQEAISQLPGAEDAKLTIPMPELIIEDLLDRIQAIQAGHDSGWASDEQATTQYWTAMGAPDVASEVEAALSAAEETAAEKAEKQKQLFPWPPEQAQQQGAQQATGQQPPSPPQQAGGNGAQATV